MKKTIKTMLAALIAVSMLPVMSAFADANVAAVDTNAKLRPATSLMSDTCDSASGFYNNDNGLAPATGLDANGNSVLKLTRTTDDFRFWKWVDSQSSTLNSAEGITYQFDFYTASNQTDGSSSGLLVYSRGKDDGGNDTNLVSLRPRPSDPNTVQIKKGGKDGEVLATFPANKWHTLAFSITHEAGSTTYTYDIYIDGELKVEDQTFTLSQDNMHFFGWRTDNWWWKQGNPTGDEYFIDNFYAYAGAAKTPEQAVVVDPTPVSTDRYELDTTAEAISVSRYNDHGTITNTDDGYVLSAQSGDFDARIWVNGSSIGNAVKADGATISFTAVLPQTNANRIYYTYSGSQGNAEKNPFVGFIYKDGGYRLLKNMSHDYSTDEFFNDKLYTGSVDIMLYLQGTTYELYADGEKIATVDTTKDLGGRWYYSFISYWAGNSDTTMTITNLKYLKGKAIKQVVLETPSLAMNPAKPAADGSNAFYYMIDVQMNDAVADSLNVKYYPQDKDESVAAVQSFNMSSIEGKGKVTFISALKGIPANQVDREIVAKAILGYELGGSVFSINASKTNALSDVK